MFNLENNKRSVYVGLVISFLIIVVIFVIFIFNVSRMISPTPKQPLSPGQGQKQLTTEDVFKKAINNKDKSACDALTDKAYRNLCYYSFTLKQAVKERNISLCDGLTKDFIKTCQNNYYFQVAQKEKNLSLCLKIAHPDLQKQCERDVAELIKLEKAGTQKAASNLTLSACAGIENERTKQVCQNLLPLEDFPTTDKCNSFQDIASRAICLQMLAKKSQIEKLSFQEVQQIVCNGIEESDIQSICFDFFEHLKETLRPSF